MGDMRIEIWRAVTVFGMPAPIINDALIEIPQHREIMLSDVKSRKFWS